MELTFSVMRLTWQERMQALAGEKINFIHRDYFDFKHDYKFDEIVTNMPVKGKKAKEDMDAFYARFFEKSKSLLAEDGIIIMYSNEVGFVKNSAGCSRATG